MDVQNGRTRVVLWKLLTRNLLCIFLSSNIYLTDYCSY